MTRTKSPTGSGYIIENNQQRTEKASCVGELGKVEHQTSSSFLDELQRSDGGSRGASKEGVAVVQAGDDKSLDQHLRCLVGGLTVVRLVGVSFGLLCVLQGALNIGLRLQAAGGEQNATVISDLRRETERLTEELEDAHYRNELHLTQQRRNITELLEQKLQLEAYIHQLESDAPRCPWGWKTHMSSCYLLSQTTKTWDDARQDCVQRGSHLATFKSPEELEALKPACSTGSAWIGLRRQRPGFMKMKWMWVDGSELTFSNWDQMTPSRRPLERCAVSVQTTCEWSAVDCENLHSGCVRRS
ncbi:uncharacterized protein LOC142990766 [Genypterus blacodes]|uniref:uncharacterized protein LOC142990766 n=1 Tax=Genypterus blacodes TaxID=154954 RepID=UPI003F768E31